MRTYICENCGAELTISADGVKGSCSSCGKEYFLVALDVVPLKKRLLKIASERNRKNTSRAADLKALATEILNKDADDIFATFYLALAEKMFGNDTPFQKFAQEANYNATQDEFNMQILRDIVVEANARYKYDIQNHIKRALCESPLAADYLARLDEVVEAEGKSNGNFFVAEKDVFVCHASEDVQTAEFVVDELSKNGIKSWISTRNIRPNSPDYWQDIQLGICNCRIMLVISSVNSMNSRDCCKELTIAKKEGLLRLEYKLDKMAHNAVFAEYFEDRQWIDSIDNGAKGVGFVIAAVKEMLEEAKLNKQRHRIEEERKEREQAEFQRDIEEKTRQLEAAARACLAKVNGANGGAGSDMLVVVKSIVNCLVSRDMATARQLFGQSVIASEAVNIVTQMALTLGDAQQTVDATSKSVLWAKLRQQACSLKLSYPAMTEEEKALYISLNNSEIMAYLCVLFFTTNELDRMEFVVNYIKVVDLYDNGICKKLLTVLLKSGHIDKAQSLLKFNVGLDGQFVLKTALECFEDGDAKIVALDDIMRKYTFDDSVAEMLNEYLQKTKESVEVSMQVVRIMAKNNIRINTAILSCEAFCNKIDFDAIDIIFDSLKGKSLASLDVDNLINFAIKKQNSEIVNATLSFLVNTCGIVDIGADNVEKIWKAIDNFSGADRILVYSKLLATSMERKTKDEMVAYYFKNQRDLPSDIVAIVNLFAEEKTKITFGTYENYLLNNSVDEVAKIEVVEKLVDVTMFFVAVDGFVKKYYQVSTDSQKTKAKIISILAKNQVNFDDSMSKNFLAMPQKSYNDGYVNILKKYLDANRNAGFEMLKIYISNKAIDEGGKVIDMIAAAMSVNFDIDAVAYFVRYFVGVDKLKLLKKILTAQTKIKKLTLSFHIGEWDAECNFAQAYALFGNGDNSTQDALEYFAKEGCVVDDKILCKKQKQKFSFADFARLTSDAVKIGEEL